MKDAIAAGGQRIAVLHPLFMDYFFALDTPPIAEQRPLPSRALAYSLHVREGLSP